MENSLNSAKAAIKKIRVTPTVTTTAYISLLRALVLDYNAFDDLELLSLLASNVLVRNPLLVCETRLGSVEMLRPDPDWHAVQIALVDLIRGVHRNAVLAAIARNETRLDRLQRRRPPGGSKMVNVGAAWCGFYNRPGLLSRLKYRALPHANRGPSLFLHTMRDAGHEVKLLSCDESLELADFSTAQPRYGLQKIHESASIFYLMTHGLFDGKGYRACLCDKDWWPSITGLGGGNTVVAVFDTCFLIDSTLNWQAIWAAANPSPKLRMMLGFDNLAGADRGTALRGKAFAENLLKGQTFVDAWFAAVSATTPVYNKAVAIAIGDTPADAMSVLQTASLKAMPGPRTSSHASWGMLP
jgi:hypothetical protein